MTTVFSVIALIFMIGTAALVCVVAVYGFLLIVYVVATTPSLWAAPNIG